MHPRPRQGDAAAVVGVVLNLGLFFGIHVLWPAGFGGPFDAGSAVLAAAAAAALMRWRRGVIEVIAACAVLGLALHLSGLK